MSSSDISDIVIALVGRPNVGKSTLFNVMTKSRDALVADYPGLTRDRKYGRFDYQSSTFIVIDTGGLSGESEEIDTHMAKQTRFAIDESDIVLFMVDGRAGLTPADEVIAESLRRTGKQVNLIVNKTDGLDSRSVSSEFYSLGLGEPICIASSQNRGIQLMLETVLQQFMANTESADTDDESGVTGEPDEITGADTASADTADSSLDDSDEDSSREEDADESIKVAIIGRPNVGKSTLVNRFLGEERVIVFDMPGTTRDSVFIPFERDGKKYTFIDTAGVRRKRAVHEAIEKFSIIKSMQAIERANVVIMMIDARTEISDQDLHLIGYVLEAGRALILAINKWDGMDDYQKELIHKGLDKQLPFVRFAETFFISALHGSGVGKLYEAIDRAYTSATQKFSTSDLTRLLEKAVQSHQPPMVNGHRIKLRYAHQGGMNPPRIIIHGNQVNKVPAAYQRYLTNFFRNELRSVGTPIKIEFKGSDSNPYITNKKHS
jgi:GTP-binding protein